MGVFVFLLDRGAGGIRTRVQSGRPYAFYMLSPACLSGLIRCRTTKLILISCYFTIGAEKSSGYPWFPCVSISGWLRAWPPGKRPVPVPGTGKSITYCYSVTLREQSYLRHLKSCNTVYRAALPHSACLHTTSSCCRNHVSPGKR